MRYCLIFLSLVWLSAKGAPAPLSWEETVALRKQWWSFQPLQMQAVPEVQDKTWSQHPVDRFILARMEEKKLSPGAPAEKRVLIRRLTFALTGLPPTPDEVNAFVNDGSRDAYAKVIDRLLASPAFGEQWARHWMDLVRYAETHGSEGDPEIPEAWRYRDYLIRAFNMDVPWDQLIRENIAGDLLPNPRWNRDEGFNESMIGAAELRMVEHGFQPVDALEDQVRVIENQIDVVGKAFQGLTISCARCHDHKFDAISQKDFYALYGIFASCRPTQLTIDAPESLRAHRAELESLKKEIKAGLAEAWGAAATELPSKLRNTMPGSNESAAVAEKMHEQITALEPRLRSFEPGGWKDIAGVARPIAFWTFEKDTRDGFGNLDGELIGGAAVRHGRLILNGRTSFLRTKPLSTPLREKTLEVWVALANTDQRGGGALSVETADGSVFDSIVFGEEEPGKWLAGSDFHRRSRSVNGPTENVRAGALIHLAIVYGGDNSITIYRNGERYGTPYTLGGEEGTLRTFAAGTSHLLIGMRHTGGGNAFLAGEIEEARLYDRALSAAEILASFKQSVTRISDQDFARLSPEQQSERDAIRRGLAGLQAEFAERFPQYEAVKKARENLRNALDSATKDRRHPLYAWAQLRDKTGEAFQAALKQLSGQRTDRVSFDPAKIQVRWDLAGPDATNWFFSGINPPEQVQTAGDFSVEPQGDRIVSGLWPGGSYSHRLSQKHNGVLTSPRFKIETDSIFVHALGGKGARVRFVVENYPIGSEGIFPQVELRSDQPVWLRLDTNYRKGSYGYIEIAPVGEVLSRGRGAVPADGRSFFGVSEVVCYDAKELPRADARKTLLRLGDLVSAEALASEYGRLLGESVKSWHDGNMNEEQSEFLDAFLRAGLLPASTNEIRGLAQSLEAYRTLENEIPVPRLVPGMLETAAYNAPLLSRGDHTKPKEPVPRRYIEALGSHDYQTSLSGRLELANEITSSKNPLTARVMVNRIWHHLFGRGLVPTVDNFGHMGERPSHPELLDFLAAKFIEKGWSCKEMIRFLVMSQSYRMASTVSERAREIDPNNLLLSHASVRRLEAEAIRDSLLAVSGRLDKTMFGPGVNALAPAAGQSRRSIYFTIRRNSLNPFLTIFDAPKPFTTLGRRDTTNVPAQSLAFLNDPFVIEMATTWAAKLVKREDSLDSRVAYMFESALARPPTDLELASSRDYLSSLGETSADILLRSESAWRDFAQSLFNLKEFIYVR